MYYMLLYLIFFLFKKDSPRRKYNVFIGGGVYANVQDKTENWWIESQDWLESGAKCLDKLANNIML